MRRLFLVLIIAMIFIIPSVIVLADGPRDKASGSVYFEQPNDEGFRRVSIIVFEESEEQSATGEMTEIFYDIDGKFLRKFDYNVVYVDMCEEDGLGYAYFGAQCTFDSEDEYIDKWIYAIAIDGGNPGVDVDSIHCLWGADESEVQNWVDIHYAIKGRKAISGNLNIQIY